MSCRKIQELLKSDYLDGEAGRIEQQHIKEHLAKCPQCRRLEEELKAQRMLFAKTEQKAVPEHIWRNIHEAIITEHLARTDSVTYGFLHRLRELILRPWPVFALTTVFTVIIFTLVITNAFIQKKQSFSNTNNGEGTAGYSLNGENGDFLYDLGTSIEEYFL